MKSSGRNCAAALLLVLLARQTQAVNTTAQNGADTTPSTTASWEMQEEQRETADGQVRFYLRRNRDGLASVGVGRGAQGIPAAWVTPDEVGSSQRALAIGWKMGTSVDQPTETDGREPSLEMMVREAAKLSSVQGHLEFQTDSTGKCGAGPHDVLSDWLEMTRAASSHKVVPGLPPCL